MMPHVDRYYFLMFLVTIFLIIVLWDSRFDPVSLKNRLKTWIFGVRIEKPKKSTIFVICPFDDVRAKSMLIDLKSGNYRCYICGKRGNIDDIDSDTEKWSVNHAGNARKGAKEGGKEEETQG